MPGISYGHAEIGWRSINDCYRLSANALSKFAGCSCREVSATGRPWPSTITLYLPRFYTLRLIRGDIDAITGKRVIADAAEVSSDLPIFALLADLPLAAQRHAYGLFSIPHSHFHFSFTFPLAILSLSAAPFSRATARGVMPVA